jgi:hypothetical protein
MATSVALVDSSVSGSPIGMAIPVALVDGPNALLCSLTGHLGSICRLLGTRRCVLGTLGCPLNRLLVPVHEDTTSSNEDSASGGHFVQKVQLRQEPRGG